jgi:ribosomal protein S18 acetylase RimI-like enzyme
MTDRIAVPYIIRFGGGMCVVAQGRKESPVAARKRPPMAAQDASSQVTIREARSDDAGVVAELVHLLTDPGEDPSPVSPAYVVEYLDAPGTTALLAELGGAVVGLLVYSLRPGLYHAGLSAIIEELAVRPEARRRGVGDALMREALCRFAAAGCKEASVSTGLENEAAKALYRTFGFGDDALLLERHFGDR